MMLVTNSAWAPTLLKREGIGIKDASLAMAMFNLGSVIATSFAGWLITRAGAAIILPVAMLGSAASVALIGYAAPSVGMVILLQGLFGAFMGGGSSGLIALAAIYYPTAIRSTGVGWAMGMGRVGSFVGPLGRRFAGGARLVDGRHFCCHSCASAPSRGDHRCGRPRQAGLSCGDQTAWPSPSCSSSPG
jgi:MFS family permease